MPGWMKQSPTMTGVMVFVVLLIAIWTHSRHGLAIALVNIPSTYLLGTLALG